MTERSCNNCVHVWDKSAGSCRILKAAPEELSALFFYCKLHTLKAKEPELPEKFSIYDRNGDRVSKLNQLIDYLKARDEK